MNAPLRVKRFCPIPHPVINIPEGSLTPAQLLALGAVRGAMLAGGPTFAPHACTHTHCSVSFAGGDAERAEEYPLLEAERPLGGAGILCRGAMHAGTPAGEGRGAVAGEKEAPWLALPKRLGVRSWCSGLLLPSPPLPRPIPTPIGTAPMTFCKSCVSPTSWISRCPTSPWTTTRVLSASPSWISEWEQAARIGGWGVGYLPVCLSQGTIFKKCTKWPFK